MNNPGGVHDTLQQPIQDSKDVSQQVPQRTAVRNPFPRIHLLRVFSGVLRKGSLALESLDVGRLVLGVEKVTDIDPNSLQSLQGPVIRPNFEAEENMFADGRSWMAHLSTLRLAREIVSQSDVMA